MFPIPKPGREWQSPCCPRNWATACDRPPSVPPLISERHLHGDTAVKSDRMMLEEMPQSLWVQRNLLSQFLLKLETFSQSRHAWPLHQHQGSRGLASLLLSLTHFDHYYPEGRSLGSQSPYLNNWGGVTSPLPGTVDSLGQSFLN